MGVQYTDSSNSNSPSRLNVGGTSAALSAILRASKHLSDGTLVFIDTDGNGSNYYLKYYTHSGTPTTIATLSAFAFSAYPYGIALCVDSHDNIYVIGCSNVGGIGDIACQGFTKGSGHSWTAQTALGVSVLEPSNIWIPVDVVWCNTGGGTGGNGHLVLANTYWPGSSSAETGYSVIDAGTLLAGSGIPLVGQSFFTAPDSVVCYAVVVATDGFGGASGWFGVQSTAGTTVTVYHFTINSAGTVTASALGSAVTISDPSGFVHHVLVNYVSGYCALVTPDTTTAGAYMVSCYSTTAAIGTRAASGSPTNMPLNSNGAAWDVFKDPVTPSQFWVIAPGTVSAGSLPVYRLKCAIGAGTPSWDAAAVLADTLAVYAQPTADIRAVKDPRVTAVDWQVDVETVSGTYALLGGFTLIPGGNFFTFL